MIYYGVALREVSHDVRFLEHGRDIQILVVPEQARLGVVDRLREVEAADVDERLCLCSLLPHLLVEFAVDLHLLRSAVAHVVAWC